MKRTYIFFDYKSINQDFFDGLHYAYYLSDNENSLRQPILKLVRVDFIQFRSTIQKLFRANADNLFSQRAKFDSQNDD